MIDWKFYYEKWGDSHIDQSSPTSLQFREKRFRGKTHQLSFDVFFTEELSGDESESESWREMFRLTSPNLFNTIYV